MDARKREGKGYKMESTVRKIVSASGTDGIHESSSLAIDSVQTCRKKLRRGGEMRKRHIRGPIKTKDHTTLTVGRLYFREKRKKSAENWDCPPAKIIRKGKVPLKKENSSIQTTERLEKRGSGPGVG